MITKNTLMTAAFMCSVTPWVFGADITGADGNPATTLTVDGTVEVKSPSTTSDDGTPTMASLPIGNDSNTGFTNSGVASTIYQFSTNGSGQQVRTTIGDGGVRAETNGNLTLEVQETQETTYNYTIESRQILVSDPAGFTDVAGTYGAPGTFYANGETLPGTQENVATVRDGDGNLLSVLTDIPGVGPLVAVDGDGDLILTQAQINVINGSGSAPAEFEVVGDPAFEGGNLQVGGDANVDGELTLTGVDGDVATAINANEAANAATQADVDQNEADSDAADVALQADIDQNELDSDLADAAIQADVDQNEVDSDAADTALAVRIDEETAARAAADSFLSTRIDNERDARIATDNYLESRIDAEAATRAAADQRLDGKIEKNKRGIAMVAAMTNTTVLPGNVHAVDFNMAHFEGETGFSFGYARAVNDKLQLKAAVSSTTDFEESVVRAGVSYQW